MPRPRPQASPFYPPTFFAVRSPTLPLAAWAGLSEGLRAPEADNGGLADCLAHDRALALAGLRAALAHPVVREALRVASPSLDAAIDAWLAGRAAEREGEVALAVFRYLTRMATRATPFGLFAAHALGRVGDATRVEAPGLRARRAVRLDGAYLSSLAEALAGDPALRDAARFQTSNAAYVSGAQVRYAEGRVDPATRERRNDTVSVEATDALVAVLARAAVPSTRGALTDFVAVREAVARDEAAAWVDSLVEAGLLTPEMAPSLTGAEPLAAFTSWVGRVAPSHPAAAALREAARALAALAAAPLGAPPDRYDAVADALDALPRPAPRGRLFQVDLHGAAVSTLDRGFVDEVERTLVALADITPWQEAPDLASFRERFVARWEGEAVPLTLALDEERGVGFGGGAADGDHPLLDGLEVGTDGDPASRRMEARDRWLLGRLHELVATGERVWTLSPADAANLRVQAAPPLADAFAVIAAALPASPGGPTVHFEVADGPSGARLLGRFCRDDVALADAVRAHLRAEEALRPDAVFAEVVHLPQGRVGNVAARPALRPWEIPYLCRAGVDVEHQITVDDLLVRVEPGGRVAIFSRRLEREVVPRMTNAHHHGAAELPIYRFLCALSTQGVRGGLKWSWGALDGALHLPRVVLGRAVVSLERWRVDAAELGPLARLDEPARRAALRAWRARRSVPRVVGLRESDSVLRLDLEHPIAADALLDHARRANAITLEEVLGDAAAHAHELVIPFVRRAATPPPPPAPPPAPSTVRRAFAPGSEWLYAKVYVGALTADALLTDVVAPLVRELRARGAVDGWFFVRYADPDAHLRLRLHGDPRALLTEALPALHAALAPWLDDGRIARVALDTYVREVERYGGDAGIARCEALFEAQSDTALAVIAATRGDEGRDGRWRQCLAGLDALLRGLGCGRARAAALLEAQRDDWAGRLGVARGAEGALSRRFRAERAALEAALANAPGSDAWAGLIGATAAHADALRVGGYVPDGVVASLLHMWVNRVMPGAQNLHEVALCDFLARLYRSELARTSRGRAA